MGSQCCSAESEYSKDQFISFKDTGGKIKLLIIALNYEYVPNATLTCTKDAKTMFRMANRAGLDDITVVTDKAGAGASNFPTRAYVLKHLKSVASRCKPGDWFVWFFAGHGVNVPDHNGDEQILEGFTEGFDQAFVTPTRDGKLKESALLIDDDFAFALEKYVPQGVRILCICDCCHSGTICDIDSFKYKHEIYQISAATDTQEAEDVGKGGVLTTALRRAVRKLAFRNGSDEFSIQSVFDRVKRSAEQQTEEQDVQLQWSGTHPELMAWPLAYHWWQYVAKPQWKVNIHDFEDDPDSDDNMSVSSSSSEP